MIPAGIPRGRVAVCMRGHLQSSSKSGSSPRCIEEGTTPSSSSTERAQESTFGKRTPQSALSLYAVPLLSTEKMNGNPVFQKVVCTTDRRGSWRNVAACVRIRYRCCSPTDRHLRRASVPRGLPLGLGDGFLPGRGRGASRWARHHHLGHLLS